jgi:hypothetical protein
MDTWTVAFVLYATLAAACVGLYKSYRHSPKGAWRVVAGAALLGVIAINGVALLVTDDYKTPGISRADVARTRGLEANKAYPALTYNTDRGEPHFTLIGFADTKNGRVLNVDFVSGGTTSPLALPANSVIVQQDGLLPARMAVVISNDTVRAYGKKRLVEPDPCRMRFAGITTCQHHPRFVTDPRDDLLDDVLRDGVKQVVIRLSPQAYSQLL